MYIQRSFKILLVLSLLVALLPLPAPISQSLPELPGITQLSSAQAAPTFNIGDYIQYGKYNNTPILWRVISKDADGDPVLFADRILSNKAFDARGGYHQYSQSTGLEYWEYNRTENGSNYYPDSNLRQWLNSNSPNSGSNKIDWIQNDPTAANVNLGENSYHNEKGFLADGNFTPMERSLIKPLTHKVALSSIDATLKDGGSERLLNSGLISTIIQNYDTTAYYKNVTDQVFLLSVKQLKEWVYDNQATLGPYYQKENVCYWLNTPWTIYNDAVLSVYTENGSTFMEDWWAYSANCGVRPALQINLSTAIFAAGGTGSATNPYVVSGAVDPTAPTAPSGLAASNVTTSGATLSWTPSSDNFGVSAYEVYQGATKIATVTGANGAAPATTYNVTGLSSATVYTFSVKAKDAAGNISESSNEVQVRTAHVVNIGDYIRYGKYNNSPILWRVIHKDASGNPVLFSDRILSLKAYDAKGTFHSGNYNRSVYGSNQYLNSNLRQWLNSNSANSGSNVIDWTQNDPIASNLQSFYNPYKSEKGFLADGNFTAGERTLMRPLTHKVLLDSADASLKNGGTQSMAYNWSSWSLVTNYDTTAYFRNVTDSVFLLSTKQLKEWVADNSSILGASYHRAYPTAQTVTQSNYISPSLNSNTYYGYWLNTPFGDQTYKALAINQNGQFTGDYAAYNSTVGVRPATVLNLVDLKFQAGTTGTAANPYIIDVDAPSAPTALSKSNQTQTSVTLSWTASTDNIGVAKYEVYRYSKLIATLNANGATPPATTYNVTGLSPNSNYEFKVKAYDANGNESAFSNTVSVSYFTSTVNINIGDYVRYGAYNDEPILWRVIHKEANGNPVLFADRILTLKAFDANGSYHTVDSNREKYGSNYYKDSNIRQWLNSSSPNSGGNIIDWIQNDPDAVIILNLMKIYGVNAYNKEKGFLADGNFTATDRSLIVPYTHKVLLAGVDSAKKNGGSAEHVLDNNLSSVSQNYDTTAYYQNIEDNVFLLSVKQVKEWVYDRAWEHRAMPTAKAVSNSGYKSPNLNISQYYYYLLNTPSSMSSDAVRFVSRDGISVKSATAHDYYAGIRPALLFNFPKAIFEPGGTGSSSSPYVVYNGSDTTAPTAPTGLSASNVTASGFTANWSAANDNTGVDTYQVFLNGQWKATVTGTQYTFSGLDDYTEYAVTVKATDQFGNVSAASSPLQVLTVDATPPQAPTGLAALAVTSTGFTLTWTAAKDNSGILAYEIIQDGVIIDIVTGIGGGAPPTSYQVTGLTNNTVYTYTVKARDFVNLLSPHSAPLTVTAFDWYSATVNVGDYVQFGKYNDVPILWRVVYKQPDGSPVMLADRILTLKAFDAKGNYHSNPTRKANGSNYYKDSNLRQWLNSSSANSGASLIDWTQNDPLAVNLDGGHNPYFIEKGFLADGNFNSTERALIKPYQHMVMLNTSDSAQKTGGTTAHILNDSWATALQNYDTTALYQNNTDSVFLPSVKQMKEWVSDNSATLGAEFLTAKPTPQAVSQSSYQTGLSSDGAWSYWLNTPVATGSADVANVRHINETGGLTKSAAMSGNVGVRPAVVIDFAAATIVPGGTGTSVNPYIVGVANDTTAPSVPTGLKASNIKKDEFTVSWNASTDDTLVTGYIVYLNGVQSTTTTGTQHTFTGLSEAKTYSVTVKAKDAFDHISAASSVLNVTTSDVTPPSKPNGLAAIGISATGFKLSWAVAKDNAGVTAYEVYKNSVHIATVIGGGGGSEPPTSFQVSGLSPLTTYVMTVKAKDAAGNVSAESDILSVMTYARSAPTLQIGDYVRYGKYNGEPILWRVIHKDANGVPILFSDRILSYKPFDANGAYHDDGNNIDRPFFGSNYYPGSNIRQWLNSDSPNSGSDVIDWIQNDPSAANFSNWGFGWSSVANKLAYDQEKGFLADGNFTATERGLIKPLTHKVILHPYDAANKEGGSAPLTEAYSIDSSVQNYDTTAYYKNVTDLVFPLSVKQVKEWVYDNQSILGADYQRAMPTPEAATLFPKAGFNINSNTISSYYLNTPVTTLEESGFMQRVILPNGAPIYDYRDGDYQMFPNGIRPALQFDAAAAAYESGGAGTLANPYVVYNGGDTTAPTTPLNLASSNVTATSFKVSWDASTDHVGVAGYKVYLDNQEVATVTDTEYVFSRLDDSTTYAVTVFAIDVAGNLSAESEPLEVVTQDITAPTVPIGLNADNLTHNSLTLTWTDSTDLSGVTAYEVYQGTTLLSNSVNETSYDVTGLTATTSYTFTVRAKDAAGNMSAFSAPYTVTTLIEPIIDTVAPTVPTGLVASGKTATGFTLGWKTSTDSGGSGLAGYEVYLDNDPTPVATVTSTNYIFSGLTPSATYIVRVLAFDNSGNKSALSAPLSVSLILDTVAPSVPSMLTHFIISPSSFTLRWQSSSDNVGVDGYEVFMDGVSKGTTPNLFMQFNGLDPSLIYKMTVLAYDEAGNKSAQSQVYEATTYLDEDPPTVPDGLEASDITASGFTVVWETSTDNRKVDGYKVYLQKLGDLQSQLHGTTEDPVYSFSGLEAGATYFVTILAFDAAGPTANESALSEPLEVTLSNDSTPPTAPENLQASSVLSESLVLSWDAATDDIGVDYYEIYSNGALYKSGDSSLSLLIEGLTMNTSYTFTVVAVDKSGKKSAASEPLTVMTSTLTQAGPTLLILNLNNFAHVTASLKYSLGSDANMLIRVLTVSNTPVFTVVNNVQTKKGIRYLTIPTMKLTGGKYYVQLIARDVVTGNRSIAYKVIQIDHTPPMFRSASVSSISTSGKNAKVNLRLSEKSFVSVRVYRGSTVVRTLMLNKLLGSGVNSFEWDGKDSRNRLLADGIYSVVFQAENMVGLRASARKVKMTIERAAPLVTNLNAAAIPFTATVGATAELKYVLSENAKVTVKIYDSSGAEVRTLVNGTSRTTGRRTEKWDGLNAAKSPVSAGTYTYRITAVDATGKTSNVAGGEITLTR